MQGKQGQKSSRSAVPLCAVCFFNSSCFHAVIRYRCWFCLSLLPLSLTPCILMTDRGKLIFQQPEGTCNSFPPQLGGSNLHLFLLKGQRVLVKENLHRFILRMIFLIFQCLEITGREETHPGCGRQQVLGQGERGAAPSLFQHRLLSSRDGDGFRETLLTSGYPLQGKAVSTALITRTRHRTDHNLLQPANNFTVCIYLS